MSRLELWIVIIVGTVVAEVIFKKLVDRGVV